MSVLLSVQHLKKYFPLNRGLFQNTAGYVKAVDDVSFSLAQGETLGLVGESGCGKSTLGRSILRLIEPSSGDIVLNGVNISKISPNAMRPYRKEMQIIFQDPYASLNPRMTVGEIVREPIEIFSSGKEKDVKEQIILLLKRVGLDESSYNRYPHEFSGGQRQRISIARALSVSPKLVVCDEPVSALDVSVRSQVLNLMRSLQNEHKLSYLFISHDLSVIRHVSDRIAVMYLGQIVELADRDQIYENSKHPYTRALLSAIPVPDPNNKRERIILNGDVPSPANPPQGCRFNPRCSKAKACCREIAPELRQISQNHYVACHYSEEE